jgi:hypothetical protein
MTTKKNKSTVSYELKLLTPFPLFSLKFLSCDPTRELENYCEDSLQNRAGFLAGEAL